MKVLVELGIALAIIFGVGFTALAYLPLVLPVDASEATKVSFKDIDTGTITLDTDYSSTLTILTRDTPWLLTITQDPVPRPKGATDIPKESDTPQVELVTSDGRVLTIAGPVVDAVIAAVEARKSE